MIDPAAFVNELARQIADHLRRGASEFKEHRLGALALDAHPWHKGMLVAILIETDEYRKWDLGDWENQYFAEVDDSPLILQAYDELRDPNVGGSRSYHPFFRCCAQALCHEAVTAALKEYTLEPDFERFVADPDDCNEVNFCEEILGVDRKIRKPKTEIVNNLDEALKDPEQVLVLKYWYQDNLTPRASDIIAQLTNLRTLYLISMGLQSLPRCVLSLSNLAELHLEYNQISQMTALSSLKHLAWLSLHDNGVLTAEMAAEIASLDHLQTLHVGKCGLKEVPAAWQSLTQLQEILLFGNPLTGLPDWLLELPRLKRIGLPETVDDPANDRVRSLYPHLEVL